MVLDAENVRPVEFDYWLVRFSIPFLRPLRRIILHMIQAQAQYLLHQTLDATLDSLVSLLSSSAVCATMETLGDRIKRYYHACGRYASVGLPYLSTGLDFCKRNVLVVLPVVAAGVGTAALICCSGGRSTHESFVESCRFHTGDPIYDNPYYMEGDEFLAIYSKAVVESVERTRSDR